MEFIIENLKVKFLDLTALEGVEISQSLMSAITFSKDGDSSIDMGRFAKQSFNLIVKKLQVQVKDADGKESYKLVGNVEDLQLFFKNPLISFEITSCFFQYLTPFLNSLTGLSGSKSPAFLK